MKKKLLSALLCLALALTLLPTAALAAPTRLKSVDLVIDLPKAGDPNEMETEVTIKSMKSGNIDLLANGAGILYTEWQGDNVETDDGYAFRAGTTYLVNIKLPLTPPRAIAPTTKQSAVKTSSAPTPSPLRSTACPPPSAPAPSIIPPCRSA